MGAIIGATLTTDIKRQRELDTIDQVILYFYVLEVIMKVTGLGVEKYYDDDWNKFDLILVVMSIASDIFIDFMMIFKAAKSVKLTKLLKISKINRVFKIFRACRTAKIFNVFMVGADIFNQV